MHEFDQKLLRSRRVLNRGFLAILVSIRRALQEIEIYSVIISVAGLVTHFLQCWRYRSGVGEDEPGRTKRLWLFALLRVEPSLLAAIEDPSDTGLWPASLVIRFYHYSDVVRYWESVVCQQLSSLMVEESTGVCEIFVACFASADCLASVRLC